MIISTHLFAFVHCLYPDLKSSSCLHSDFIACGEPDVVDVEFEVGDCDEEIPFYYSCQIRASSQNSPLTQPSNSLEQNEGRWSPAVRTGGGWKHHIDFDFLAVARIKGVSMLPFAAGMLETTAKTVLILKGSGPNSYKEVGAFKSTAISFNETIQASASSYDDTCITKPPNQLES